VVERFWKEFRKRKKASEIINVNPRYVSDAKRLQNESPELAAEVSMQADLNVIDLL
jgi:hypothetical protein